MDENNIIITSMGLQLPLVSPAKVPTSSKLLSVDKENLVKNKDVDIKEEGEVDDENGTCGPSHKSSMTTSSCRQQDRKTRGRDCYSRSHDRRSRSRERQSRSRDRHSRSRDRRNRRSRSRDRRRRKGRSRSRDRKQRSSRELENSRIETLHKSPTKESISELPLLLLSLLIKNLKNNYISNSQI